MHSACFLAVISHHPLPGDAVHGSETLSCYYAPGRGWCEMTA